MLPTILFTISQASPKHSTWRDFLTTHLEDDFTAMIILSVIAIPILGLLFYIMDDDGEQEKAKKKAAEEKKAALQEKQASYDLGHGRADGEHGGAALDAKRSKSNAKIALGFLVALAAFLALYIERHVIEDEIERDVHWLRELLTMRGLAPFVRGIHHNHPIEAAVILALCGFLLFAVMLMRMPGDKEYEMATRRADAQRLMPS